MSSGFERFVGIDWSGDKKVWQKALKIAVALPGRSAPVLVDPPSGQRGWSRTEAATWIEDQCLKSRALIGLDFAFGFPPVTLPQGTVLDWEYVEKLCERHSNLYGGAFFRPPTCEHSHLINSPWLPRDSYSADDLRTTDVTAMKLAGARPQSIFNAIGPAQVGPSSISGMRALRLLRARLGDRVTIWPFDELRPTGSVIVEIFPRYYPLSKGKNAKLAHQAALNDALAAFESEGVRLAPKTEDEGDALLSAAALRYLSRESSLFRLPDLSIRSEGWIFGVPVESYRPI